MPPIYHLARGQEWTRAAERGVYAGTEEDRADGYLHFSTAAQIEESAMRHRAGEADLMLVACEAAPLGDALKWEPARGGDLFPHLYGDLPMAAVVWAKPLALGADGRHRFPPLE